MYGTGLGTSLMLIAAGAVLAFAVNYQSSGIDINTVGVILMIVGLIGMLMSLMLMGAFDWSGGRTGHVHEGPSGPPVTYERDVVRDVDPPATETTITRTTRRR